MDATQKQELRRLFASRLTGAVRMYLEACTHCGTCIPACHAYASEPELRHSSVGRAENIRRLFWRHFRPQGRLAGWLNEAVELSEDWMEKVYETAYTCTGCRRCVTYCPFGIDTQQIQSIAKLLLIGAGREPQVLSMLADMSIAKGENVEATKASFTQAVQGLEEEVIARWRSEAGREAIPIDEKDADLLYVALAGKHSIIPAAAIMNAAGENWSLSYFEAVNFGAFVGNPEKTREISQRIIDEAVRLGVREVAICECGTAYRVMKFMMGELPFRVVSFVEVIARYLREGRIQIDPRKTEQRLTYHDPCQIARNGGVMEEAREILAHLTRDFVELQPNRVENWCCGGGGGLVAMGEKEFRMRSARVKAEQVRATGAEVLATACENCHTQLSDLNEHYALGMRVAFLSDLVSQALVASQ
ncbi:MAG: 4Fe-4S dicluster domain-containing protein [Candidatus Eisenbacteria bacterium]|nr:4Fe-4S dicluster domain-containing protein [Candidatus Eisenbacteria bacterium]